MRIEGRARLAKLPNRDIENRDIERNPLEYFVLDLFGNICYDLSVAAVIGIEAQKRPAPPNALIGGEQAD
jgi:hypothetical protein